MGTEDDDIEVLYRLRWYFRYPIAIGVITAAAWLTATMLDMGKNEWLVYGLGGLGVLFGASLAWELSLIALGIGFIWYVTTWDKSSQLGLGLVCFLGYAGHLFDKAERVTAAKIANLQQQIDNLRSQIRY